MVGTCFADAHKTTALWYCVPRGRQWLEDGSWGPVHNMVKKYENLSQWIDSCGCSYTSGLWFMRYPQVMFGDSGRHDSVPKVGVFACKIFYLLYHFFDLSCSRSLTALRYLLIWVGDAARLQPKPRGICVR